MQGAASAVLKQTPGMEKIALIRKKRICFPLCQRVREIRAITVSNWRILLDYLFKNITSHLLSPTLPTKGGLDIPSDVCFSHLVALYLEIFRRPGDKDARYSSIIDHRITQFYLCTL